MRRFAIIGTVVALASVCSAQTRFRRIRVLGEFSNVRITAEHSYGYAVDLWRVDNSVAGLLMVPNGLQGDPPTEVLDRVKFDPRTGALSFTAKMTTGCNMLPGGKMTPARESFEFSGVLSDDVVKGKMTRTDLDRAGRSPEVVSVELAKGPAPPTLQAGSYTEWKENAEELVRDREPRCRGIIGEPAKKKR